MYGTGWDVCDLDVIGWDEKGLKMDQLVGRLTGWWDMRSITVMYRRMGEKNERTQTILQNGNAAAQSE